MVAVITTTRGIRARSRVMLGVEAPIRAWADWGREQRRDELPGFRVPRLEGRGRNKRAAGARRVPRVDHAESPQGHLPDAAGFERTRRPQLTMMRTSCFVSHARARSHA